VARSLGTVLCDGKASVSPWLRVRIASCGSLITEPIGAEFHTEARRHGAWVLCGASALDKTLHVITVITYEIDGQTCKNRQF